MTQVPGPHFSPDDIDLWLDGTLAAERHLPHDLDQPLGLDRLRHVPHADEPCSRYSPAVP